MYELSITKDYPAQDYNLLGNTNIIVQIPDIKTPVVQAVTLDADPKKGDVYIQQKGSKPWTGNNGVQHAGTETKYALTKVGLGKLADKAGIKMISSEQVIPSTCRKCVAVNSHVGKFINCGKCTNKDIAFRVTIAVPQLTGEILTFDDTNEIIVENATAGMSKEQRTQFMKYMPQICEAKALNGAIRTALHIKGTYTLEELKKPFVVAYLVPNLNHEDVKKAAIDSMFASSRAMFGTAPAIRETPGVMQIEAGTPQIDTVEALGENIDEYVDGTYTTEELPPELSPAEPAPQPQSQPQPAAAAEEERSEFFCDKCNSTISEKVWDYSVKNFGRPLCYKCQREERGAR